METTYMAAGNSVSTIKFLELLFQLQKDEEKRKEIGKKTKIRGNKFDI
jgi:hypothetical protein